MQILHTSDTHLGCAQFDYSEREQDVYDAFFEIVERAVKDRVDAIVHAGDIFHIPKPSGTSLVKLADGLKILGNEGIKVYFTLGEHDISRISGTPSAYLFHKLGLATYVGSGEPVYHDNLMIIGYHKHRRGESDALLEKLKRAEQLAGQHAGKKLLILHQGLTEFHKWAGEMNVNDLPQSFSYYAMGHIHEHFEKKFERLSGPVCYPGSIDPTPGEGIKEFKKGYYIVDLSGAEAKTDWVEIKSSRRQFSHELAYSELNEKVVEISQTIKGMQLQKKPMMVMKVKGEDIDGARVMASLASLQEYCLHYTWEVLETRRTGELVYGEKPSDIHQEMLNLASSALGRDDLAQFAVQELLPLLEGENTEEALETVFKAFENSRFGDKRN